MNLLMHPATAKEYDKTVLNQPQSLLIIGQEGAGKRFIARELTTKLLGTDNLDSYPYFHEYYGDSKEGIDAIRQIIKNTGLKTPGKGNVRRIILINNAEKLSIDAQNTFLKTLEEPPEGTMLILTAPSLQSLPKTIVSRCARLEVRSIPENQLRQATEVSEDSFNKNWLVSGGLAGLFFGLLNQEDNPVIQTTQEAKLLISSSVFDRLNQINDLSKDRERVLLILKSMLRIFNISFENSVNAKDVKLSRFHSARKKVKRAITAVEANQNIKLVLTDLFVNI